jgi:hypothetical protein
MAENAAKPKKAAAVKKTPAPEAVDTNIEAIKEAKPKVSAKPRKATAPKKEMASVTPIDINREPAQVMVSPTRISTEQIATLAHQYWLERGCQHGNDAADWFRAERELRGKAS